MIRYGEYMYREIQIVNNEFANNITEAGEIKELTRDFTENLLSIINGVHADSIILNAGNSESAIYINLLPLFEDVAEIINTEIEIEEINGSEVKVFLAIIYISDRIERKSQRIEYKLFFERNELGGYEIVSTEK
jgi:hypothetical protein